MYKPFRALTFQRFQKTLKMPLSSEEVLRVTAEKVSLVEGYRTTASRAQALNPKA